MEKKKIFWHFSLHFVLKTLIRNIFQITEKKQQTKNKNFLTNIWQNNWCFSIWHRKRTPLTLSKNLGCRNFIKNVRKKMQMMIQINTNLGFARKLKDNLQSNCWVFRYYQRKKLSAIGVHVHFSITFHCRVFIKDQIAKQKSLVFCSQKGQKPNKWTFEIWQSSI